MTHPDDPLPGPVASADSSRGQWRVGRIEHWPTVYAPAAAEIGASGREVVERDFDQRAVAGHRLDVLALPDRHDVLEDRPPLGLVGDDPRRRGKIGGDLALEVDGQVRVRVEVQQPGAVRSARSASR